MYTKAKLIVLEGTDGSGKSTQVEMIKKYFNDKKLNYSFYHFPMYGHNDFSKAIAKFLQGDFGANDEVDPLFVANLYAMDRYKFMPTLQKDLDTLDVVLLDRYVFSNIAFQCAKIADTTKKIELSLFIKQFEFKFLELPYPDLNIFFNLPTYVVEQRLKERENENREYLNGKKDIHEQDIKFQERVRIEYLNSMIGIKNCMVVNCVEDLKVLTPDEVFDKYIQEVDLLLEHKY